MVIRNGWKLFWHSLFKMEIERLKKDVLRAKQNDPINYKTHPKYKLLETVRNIIFFEIPANPTHCRFNLSGNLSSYKREKFGNRRRLFFRYFSNDFSIIYLWLNNEDTLRKDGSKTDPYQLFSKMVSNGVFKTNQNDLKENSELVQEDILE
ncbi:MAG: type II toxin-antitoxin system YhaV family toxin [Chitinispirillaceae bacterium]|nr:type II toxin-antitoxin system YhaV family toxin [Chitinispirillaceae bacterium]